MRKSAFVQLLLVALASVGSVLAQGPAKGVPPFSSTGGGPFDVINLGNGNVHFAIPVVHKAGRGTPFTYDLTYDSSVWAPVLSGSTTIWSPVSNWGWTANTQSNVGYVIAIYYTQYYTCNLPGGGIGQPYSGIWMTDPTYVDQFGVWHPFGMGLVQYFTNGQPCQAVPPGQESMTSTSYDGSGLTLSMTWETPTGTVTTRSGAVSTVSVGSGGGLFEDTNGNIETSSSGQFFDTLSGTTPVLTVAGFAPNPIKFTYTPPSAPNVFYTMNFKAYTLATNFAVAGIGEYGATVGNLVDTIQLPDGTSYSFSYEPTPSLPASGACTPKAGTSSCVTGRIASVTLPTGGSITYSYSGGGSGVNGVYSDGSVATLTRTLNPGGTWTYARTNVSGSQWQTIISDPTTPTSNQTVIQFQKLYETQRQIYQGGISSNACSATVTNNCLLLTTVTCYNSHATNCTTTAVLPPISEKDVTLQYPNGQQSKTTVNYNSVGLVTSELQNAYGASAPGSLLQSTSISYAPLGNIVDHPSLVTVYDGAHNLKSQTAYAYDESAYPVQSTSGTPEHTSPSGSRGNLTTITYYKTASATLSKHFQYYDTGTLYKSWDVNGTSTSYTSYSYSTTAQSCGNSFATTVTSPPTPNVPAGLSVSTAWNCSGGVATSSTDANGNSVGSTYTDPYFWRPASSQDQLLNTTTFAYTPASGSVPASTESKMLFNSNLSVAEQLTTVDGFLRVLYSQQQEGVGSVNYDSAQTNYDALGRPYQSTMPFVAAAGQGSSTAAVTTTSYDGLGRVIQVNDGGNGYVKFSYSQNDVLQINGPAPSGENLKQKQLEYDALGRLVSVCEITAGTASAPSGSCGQQTALPSPPGSGYLTTYSYGFNSSNQPTVTVAQNSQPGSSGAQTRTYVYDLMGRLLQETNPETGNLAPGTTYYTYDTDSTCTGTYNGDLVKKIDNRGNTTCYTYDALHRVQTITYATSSPDYAVTPAKTFVYDVATYGSTGMSNALGRLAEAFTGPSTSKATDEFFSYSKRGELTDVYEHTPNSGTPYFHSSAGFWANGTVSSLTLLSPANLLPSQAFGVDGKGRPTSVTASSSQNSNVVGSTTYDLVHYKTTVNFGSGDSDVFTGDSNTGRLKNYTFNVGSNSDSGTLTWYSNGSLAVLTIADTVPGTSDSMTCNSSYDDLARIAKVNCGNTVWRQAFSYDAFGNIKKDSTGFTGLTFAPGYSNTTNQFTSLAGVTPTYDLDGRLTYDAVNHYTWDADSKLYTVDTSPSTTVTYDALGRMVEKTVGTSHTQIVYSPLGSKLAVMSAQTLQKGFVPLPSGSQAVYTSSGLAYYRHTDHLGSSRLATTPSRTPYSSTAYAPFGEPYKQAGTTDLSFTGQDQDTVSGMHDFLARRYMPTQGRWLIPDPAGLSAVNPANPQSWNRYAYVNNKPLALVDPLGLFTYIGGGCMTESDPTCDGGDPVLGGGDPNPPSAGGCPVDPVLGVPNCGGGGGSGGGGGDGGALQQATKNGLNALNNTQCALAVAGGSDRAAATLGVNNGSAPLASITTGNVPPLPGVGVPAIETGAEPAYLYNASGTPIAPAGVSVTMTINTAPGGFFDGPRLAGYSRQLTQAIGLLHDTGHAALYNDLASSVITDDPAVVGNFASPYISEQNDVNIAQACFPQGDFGGNQGPVAPPPTEMPAVARPVNPHF
jgi:RHS repeat-associated protein